MKSSSSYEEKGLAYKIISGILSVIAIVMTVAVIYQIITLNVFPQKLLIPVVALIVVLLLLLIVLMDFASHRIWSKIISCILVVAFSCSMGIGNVYLYKTMNTLTSVTSVNKGKVKNTISIITKNESDLKLKDLSSHKVGVLRQIDKTGTKKCIADVKKEGVTLQTKKYDNVQAEVQALYDGNVDAIILNEVYRANVEEMENYTAFSNETKVIHKTVFYTNDENQALVVDDITKNPFTILISGNDTFGEINEVSRSDVNMLVTVNPTTSTVLMVNIPRDYYIQTSMGMDKLTHTGMSGVDETKSSIENLLGIQINYTFRVNFSSAEQIVDALGGVDIEVPEGMAVERFNADWSLEGVTEGWNHLDGKRALAYSRERHAYVDGDFQRARNQQQVLQAIINKAASSTLLTNYTQLLSSFEGAFDTNMSTNEITALLKYELQAKPKWKFQNYVLRGTSSSAVCASMAQELSVVMPDDYSVNIATKKINAVMNGKSANKIKDKYQTENSGIAQGYIDQENAEAYGYGTTTVDNSATQSSQYVETQQPQTTYTPTPDTSYDDNTTTDTPSYDPSQDVTNQQLDVSQDPSQDAGQ